MCFGNLLRTPFTGTPCHGFAITNQVIHGPHDRFRGCIAIGTMAKDDIDILEFETLEGSFHSFINVLATETNFILAIATPKELCRNEIIRPTP
jgi:hypothetical protein